MPLNFGAGEDSWEFLRQQEDQTNQSYGNLPWILIGRTGAEAEAPVFWSPVSNNWLIGKIPDAGKDWGQKEKRVLEDEMAGRHHQCNGHELGQTLGDGEKQRGLVCCSPWGHSQTWLGDWTTTATCECAGTLGDGSLPLSYWVISSLHAHAH